MVIMISCDRVCKGPSLGLRLALMFFVLLEAGRELRSTTLLGFSMGFSQCLLFLALSEVASVLEYFPCRWPV